MQNRSPIGLTTPGAFLCLLLFPATGLAEPFPTQDQNPFSLINGQPQPVSAKLPEKREVQWSLGLDITNTLNSESTPEESLFLDFESYMARLSVHYGLSDDWAMLIDIPLIDRGAGFLDSAIDGWHDTFGLPQAERPNFPRDKFQISYLNNGITVYDIGTSTEGIGDIQLGLGHQLLRVADTSISFWLVADLPTGDSERLTGNESLDVSLLLAGGYRFSEQWSMNTNLGLLIPGSFQLGTLKSEDEALFGHVEAGWSPSPGLDVKIQLAGHTRYYAGSELKLLGNAYNIVFGGTVHFGECSELDLAVSEDIMVGATPDVSFLFTWRSRSCD